MHYNSLEIEYKDEDFLPISLGVPVDTLSGANSTGCLAGNSSFPCQNLTWVFQQGYSDSTHYVLSEGQHYLTETTPPFENLNSLAITGAGSAVVTCTDPETGLAFINVVNVTLSNVAFFQCAAVRNSTSKNFVNMSIIQFQVGLYFYLCESINMSHVSVIHSPDAMGVVIYDTNGTNTFSHSNFSYNSVSNDSVYPGGGGFYVEFTYCEPGMLPCAMLTNGRNKGATYTFTSCEFSHNRADSMDTDDVSTYIIPFQSDHEAFGRGGGLSVFFKGVTSEVQVTVLNCTFRDNIALWGGGVFVEFHDSSHSNIVYVSGCTFQKNRCLYSISQGTEGGGMRVGHYVYGLNGPLPTNAAGNMVTIEHSFFLENSALHGGGLSVSLALQQANQSQLVVVHLVENNFENNTAKLGSAVNYDRFGSIMKGLMGDMELQSCNFRYNSIQYAEKINASGDPYQVGIGAIHVDEVPIWFKGEVLFEENDGSALSVIGATVNFNDCHAHFLRNRGSRGGGIALLGAAYILIGNLTRMEFEENEATNEGGAIYNTYISRENLKSDSNCFIRHIDPFLHPDEWNATFLFSYNTYRNHLPNAIHSTSIFPCSVPGGSGLTNSSSRIFCWKNWRYSPHILHCNSTTQITSDIGSLDFERDMYVRVAGGWPFSLPVKLHDDLMNEIPEASFSVTYNDTSDVNVYRKDSVVVRGEPDSTIELSIDSLGQRIWHFDLLVELVPCPAGFIAASDSFPVNDSDGLSSNHTDFSTVRCDCGGTYGGVILCDESSKIVQLLNGMWIGKLNESDEDYIVMDCPLHFCERSNGISSRYISVNYQEDKNVDWDHEICGAKNRTGINCGQCVNGSGMAVNSLTYECVECTNINRAANIVIYIASVYLPLAALFTILIVFDIRLTTGPANAFILYCQVVTSTFDLNADGGIPTVSAAERTMWYVYRLPFGIFNLKFIESVIPPICFTTNPKFNTLSVLLLDYIVALFPLLMIILAVVGLKISESCNKRLGDQHRRRLLSISRLASVLSIRNKKKKISDALLPAFASFVLLSYNKFSTTSAYILTTQNPISQSGESLYPDRIYFASQLTTSSADYLLYYIPALLVFMTIVPFTPLVLLEYPLKAVEWGIVRVKILRRLYPIDKVHLFLNMFQGCYRNRMRFFAGLYFMFRFIINLTYIVTDNWLQQFLVQQIATTVMIALLAIFQPYEWWILNYVDILIFTNMALLNSVSFYLYSFAKVDPNLNPSHFAIAIQYMLVFLPLIYMVSYIIWNVTRSRHARMKLAFQKLFKPSGYEPLDSSTPADSELPDSVLTHAPRRSFVDKREFEDDFEAMLSRAEDQNTYMPSLSKSVTVVEVSGKHSEGEANAYQTTVSEDSRLRSAQPSPENYSGTAINSRNNL